MNPDLNIHVPIELLEKTIDFSPYGYVIDDCGQKGNPVIFVNKAFQEITGYKAKDILGKKCSLLLGNNREQKPLEKLRNAIKTGRQCTVVVRNYKKNGSLFYNELTIISSKNNRSGKESYRIWSLRDISEFVEQKKSLDLLLTDKKERNNFFLENTNEAIWRIEFDPPISIDASESIQVHEVFNSGIFTEANDVVAHIYGYAKGEDVCGKPLKEFMERTNPKNVVQITDIVRNKFKIKNLITFEKGLDNKTKVILNNITPTLSGDEVLNVWGASLDVSELFKTRQNLREHEEKLAIQKMALEDKNIALKELIGQIELEKRELKNRVMANIENVILPSFEKIRLNRGKGSYIEQHRIALENLTSSFGIKISNRNVKLSPREIEVCGLVRNGMINKEIARMLNIAVHTVEKHRRMARKKLEITNKGINLHTYLNSQ